MHIGFGGQFQKELETKETRLHFFIFYFLCHCRQILLTCSLTRSLHDTWKWVFWAYARKGKGVAPKHFFLKNNILFDNLSLQVNIRNTFFDQKSPQHPEVVVSLRHKHTDDHDDSLTDPAQSAKSRQRKKN